MKASAPNQLQELSALHQWRLDMYSGVSVPERTSRYTAALGNRVTGNVSALGGSANWHLSAHDRRRLVALCRELQRNNSVFRTIHQRKIDMVVGDGPIVSGSSGDEKWDRAFADLWREWSEGLSELGHPDVRRQLNVSGLCRQIVGAWNTDGDIGVLDVAVGGRQCVQLIDSCLIGSAIDGPKVDASGSRVEGVERNEFGEPVAYVVYSYDSMQGYAGGKGSQRRIDAANMRLLANPTTLLPGQDRGEPGMQSLGWILQLIDSCQFGITLAIEIASRASMIVTSERPADTKVSMESTTDPNGPANGGDEQLFSATDLPMASVLHFKSGTNVTQFKPEHPAANVVEFLWSMLSIACAEQGVPMPVAFYRAQELSFAQLKSMTVLASRTVEPLQNVLASQFVQPLVRRKIQEWTLAGLLPRLRKGVAGRAAVQFQGPPTGDFPAEVAAWSNAIKAGLADFDTAIQALFGTSALDTFNRLKGQYDTLRNMQIPIMSTPGSQAIGPSTPDASQPASGEVVSP